MKTEELAKLKNTILSELESSNKNMVKKLVGRFSDSVIQEMNKLNNEISLLKKNSAVLKEVLLDQAKRLEDLCSKIEDLKNT